MNLLAALLVLAAPALQEKVAIKSNWQKGDKIVRSSVAESTLNVRIIQRDQEREQKVETRKTERRIIHVLEAADGKPTKLIYDCEEDIEARKPSEDSDWVTAERPLHGRKITVSLVEGKETLEDADQIPERELKRITLEDRSALLYPKDPVAVGDSWEVPSADVRKFLGNDEMTKGSCSVKLAEVKDVDGRRCAILTAKLDISGRTSNGLDATVKLEGDAVVWLERGYMLSFKAKGTSTASGPTVKAEGPITLEMTTKVE
jgi:hypothetical protein